MVSSSARVEIAVYWTYMTKVARAKLASRDKRRDPYKGFFGVLWGGYLGDIHIYIYM